MTVHLVVIRPSFRRYDQLANFLQKVDQYGRLDNWTATLKFVKGDCALFYFTKIMSIMAIESIIKLNPQMGKQLKERVNDIELFRNAATSSKVAGQEFIEGGIKEISQELIKRNPQLRSHAIAKYGYSCQLCGFNFGEFYGKFGEGYIEVHHLKPLSDRRKVHNATVDEVKVVCANCHRVLHRNGKKPLSIHILKKSILRR